MEILLAGITKNEGSMFVQLYKPDAIHDNLTNQDFVDFYKAIAKSFPGVDRMDLAGEY